MGDIDFVIVLNTNKRIYDRIGDILDLCKPRVAVEFIVYTPREFDELSKTEPFVINEILNKGKMLYEAA